LYVVAIDYAPISSSGDIGSGSVMYFRPVAVVESTTRYWLLLPAESWVKVPLPVPTRTTPLAVKLAAVKDPPGLAICA